MKNPSETTLLEDVDLMNNSCYRFPGFIGIDGSRYDHGIKTFDLLVVVLIADVVHIECICWKTAVALWLFSISHLLLFSYLYP